MLLLPDQRNMVTSALDEWDFGTELLEKNLVKNWHQKVSSFENLWGDYYMTTKNENKEKWSGKRK